MRARLRNMGLEKVQLKNIKVQRFFLKKNKTRYLQLYLIEPDDNIVEYQQFY